MADSTPTVTLSDSPLLAKAYFEEHGFTLSPADMSSTSRLALQRLKHQYISDAATLASGKPVASAADAIELLLETVADAEA